MGEVAGGWGEMGKGKEEGMGKVERVMCVCCYVVMMNDGMN